MDGFVGGVAAVGGDAGVFVAVGAHPVGGYTVGGLAVEVVAEGGVEGFVEGVDGHLFLLALGAVLAGGPDEELIAGAVGETGDCDGGVGGVDESARATGEAGGTVFDGIAGGVGGGAVASPGEAAALVGDVGGVQVARATEAEAKVVEEGVEASVGGGVAEGNVAGCAGIGTEVNAVAMPLIGRVYGAYGNEGAAVVGGGDDTDGEADAVADAAVGAPQGERDYTSGYRVFGGGHDDEVAGAFVGTGVEFEIAVAVGFDHLWMVVVGLQDCPVLWRLPWGGRTEVATVAGSDAVGAGGESVDVVAAAVGTAGAPGTHLAGIGLVGVETGQVEWRRGVGDDGGGGTGAADVFHVDAVDAAVGAPCEPCVVRGDAVDVHIGDVATAEGDVVEVDVAFVAAVEGDKPEGDMASVAGV